MANPPRRRFGPARALVTLIVLLALTACGGGDQGAVVAPRASPVPSVPADPPVEVIGLPDDVEFELADTLPGVENGENLSFVSPVYALSPAGPIGSPVTVRLRLDNALPTTSPPLIATRASSTQPWDYLPGVLTGDQRHVDYETTSFAEVGVLALDLDGALTTFQEDFRAGLANGINRAAKKPTCEGADEARKLGYTVAASKTKTLFWCFGLEGGKRVVKVTSRRPIPVEVAHPEIPVLNNPPVANAWVPWFRALGTGNTVLAPGRTATYDADLEPKTELLLNAESGALGQSMRVLQAGVRALVLRLARFGTPPAKVVPTVSAFLAMPQCAKALSKGSNGVIAGCFSKAKLVKVFGSRAQLVALLVAAPSFAPFLRQQTQGIAVEAKTTQRQRILVRRAAPDFTTLSALWAGPRRILAIDQEGRATEQITDDTGARIIDLTYRLVDPDTEARVSTAKATLVRVVVGKGKRKLVKGRVPRVGNTGTITLRNGVITSPFLTTRYCDRPALKRGACGKVE